MRAFPNLDGVRLRLEAVLKLGSKKRTTGKLIPAVADFPAFWSQQVGQYPPKGPKGISYFKGEVNDEVHVDCLLYRDDKGKLIGVLNHYPFDMPPYEDKGNINVMVDPAHQGEGIGKALLKDAMKRWNVNLSQQNWTPSGDRLRNSLQAEEQDYLVWEVGQTEDEAFRVRALDPEDARAVYRKQLGVRSSVKLLAKLAPKSEPVRIKLSGKMKTISTKKESAMNPTVNLKLESLRRALEAKSMTFGVLPSKADFDKAFKREVPEGEYPYVFKGSDARVANDAGVPTHGKFDADELFDIVKKLTKAWEDDEDEAAGSLASDILGTLGFEWI